MKTLFTLSEEELHSDKWQVARFMCERYGYDLQEITGRIAQFRMDRAEARAAALRELAARQPPDAPAPPANLVHFNTVRRFWDVQHQRWTLPDIIYIGRAMPYLNIGLPASPFANPFRIEKDTEQTRADAIELYAEWITASAQAHLLRQLDHLRGKTLVCWCKAPAPGKSSHSCHGDVLLKLMLDKPSYAAEAPHSQTANLF